MEGPLDIHPRQLGFKGCSVFPSSELVESIRQYGIINPLIAARRGQSTSLSVYIGNQRLAAARMLNLSKVPVVIVDTKQELITALEGYQCGGA